MPITLYREGAMVRIEGCADLVPLDAYIAETITRGSGAETITRVIIRHGTQGTWDDDNEVWQNIMTYAPYDQYQDNLSAAYGTNNAETVTALNVLLSSP